jgi:Tol biopolymer transport system component
VTIWDARTFREIRTLPNETGGICYDVAFDPDFARIAWARDNGTIEIKDATSSRLLLSLAGHTEFACRVAFSPDGQHLASAGGDGTVRVWDAVTGRQIHVLLGFRDVIFGLGFSPDGRRLALAGWDHDELHPDQVKVWDAATGQPLPTLGKSFDYGNMAFHPDSQRLARSVGADILILDIASGRSLLRLRGHTAKMILSMAFSPDGRRLASVAQDGTVKLWETATGRDILTLVHGRDELLTGVSFSPDGQQIVSTSKSGTVKVWDATPLPEPSGG